MNGLWLKFIIGINSVLSVKFSTTFFYKSPMIVFFEYQLDVHIETFSKMQNLKLQVPMDSRDKSRRLFLFLEWDIDKDEKFEISGPNGLW